MQSFTCCHCVRAARFSYNACMRPARPLLRRPNLQTNRQRTLLTAAQRFHQNATLDETCAEQIYESIGNVGKYAPRRVEMDPLVCCLSLLFVIYHYRIIHYPK
jgi:hypothetical protein